MKLTPPFFSNTRFSYISCLITGPLFSNLCFAEKAAPITKDSIILLPSDGSTAKDEHKDSVPMKSSLQDFFNIWPSSKYLQMTPRSGKEQFGGVSALDAREDHFMSFGISSETEFFSVTDLRFASVAEAKHAFEVYAKESDPVRGHAMPWEIVVPKGERLFYMRTGREFSQRAKLLDAFLKAVDAPKAPKFICIDTYGCTMR